MKVFTGITNAYPIAGLNNHIYGHQELIWEKSSIKEVTVKEIADKFGIDVKELRIKDND